VSGSVQVAANELEPSKIFWSSVPPVAAFSGSAFFRAGWELAGR